MTVQERDRKRMREHSMYGGLLPLMRAIQRDGETVFCTNEGEELFRSRGEFDYDTTMQIKLAYCRGLTHGAQQGREQEKAEIRKVLGIVNQ